MASRLELRKMAEAAEAREAGETGEKTDKKRKRATAAGAKKKPVKKKSRAKPVERRRIVWVIYNNTQKEEDRFPFEQKKEAEERIEVLRSKSKRLYWLQPVKEVLGAAAAPVTDIYEEPLVPEVEADAEEEELEEEEEEEAEEEDDDDDDE